MIISNGVGINYDDLDGSLREYLEIVFAKQNVNISNRWDHYILPSVKIKLIEISKESKIGLLAGIRNKKEIYKSDLYHEYRLYLLGMLK